MGIQGLNLWNVLFACIFLAWFVRRRQERLTWDMPRNVKILLLLYLGIILVGFMRAVLDRSYIRDYPFKSLISDELINTIKWVLPGLLVFDGCRTRGRLRWVSVCLLGMYLLLGLQVISRLPFSSALGGGGDGMQRIRLKLCRQIGYGAVDMSVILAGGAWALVAATYLARQKLCKIALLVAGAVTTFAMALTGGRAGFVAWGGVGLILCLVRWRRYLIIAPAVPLLLYFAFPGAAQRALTGFGQTDAGGSSVTDNYEVTSGRNMIWPHVVDKISESPIIGYGRLGMRRSGLNTYLGLQVGQGEQVAHPHNVYLEWLLDNGLLGFIPVMVFYVLVVARAMRLFRDRDPHCAAVGGICLALVVVQLIAGLGSQHFYPQEGTLGMWVAMFLMFRLCVERGHMLAPAPARTAWAGGWRAHQAGSSTAL